METGKNNQGLVDESILRKIQKALQRAEGNSNEHEARTSMLLAQKLMAKHNITIGEVSDVSEKPKEIIETRFRTGSKLQWWEKDLGDIISHNFRCKFYWYRKIQTYAFLGLKEDAEIGKEVFMFARSAMKHHTSKFMLRVSGRRAPAIKKNYMLGFLAGLSEAFRDQVARESFQLTLVIDEAVTEKYKGMKIKSVSIGIPDLSLDSLAAHISGYEDGKEVDYKRNRIKQGKTVLQLADIVAKNLNEMDIAAITPRLIQFAFDVEGVQVLGYDLHMAVIEYNSTKSTIFHHESKVGEWKARSTEEKDLYSPYSKKEGEDA